MRAIRLGQKPLGGGRTVSSHQWSGIYCGGCKQGSHDKRGEVNHGDNEGDDDEPCSEVEEVEREENKPVCLRQYLATEGYRAAFRVPHLGERSVDQPLEGTLRHPSDAYMRAIPDYVTDYPVTMTRNQYKASCRYDAAQVSWSFNPV